MRKLLATAFAAVIATTTLGTGSASAQVAGPIPEQTGGIVRFNHTVRIKQHDRNKAIVRVRYVCEGVGVHLWASVKQGRNVNKYVGTAERPSPPAAIARAWYETPEGPVPFCDGKPHTLRYTISRATEGTPEHPDAWQRLKRGRAWAQFVIFTVPEGANPTTEPTRAGGFAGWVKVVKPTRHGHH